MKYKTVNLPQLLWYQNDEVKLRFPSSWEINVCYMKGHRRPPLTRQQLKDTILNPIGTKQIRKLAKGKKEVVILFDDMTRPTRVAEIVPFVLEELKAAGIKDDQVRFIAAVGAHGALTRLDFAKKLGEDVLSRFPVYNHNPYENCTFAGNTRLGTPVSVNSEVMNCDLKIGIGSIVPHPMTGFGGGGKIILPGVASIDTMTAHHRDLVMKLLTEGKDPGIGLGTFEDNLMRQDIAESAELAGLDIKIDSIVNTRGQIIGLVAGKHTAAHAEGVKLARAVYATKPIEKPDIVIINAYCKASESVLAIPILAGFLTAERKATVVLIANAPEGQVTHYLVRSFGKKVGGRLWNPPTAPPQNFEMFIACTPHIELAGADWLASLESIVWASNWDEVLEKLRKTYGETAKVAIVPDATLQYLTD